MTVEYALTRSEIVRGFFQGLSSSPKYRKMMLQNSVILGGIVLIERASLLHSFTARDVFISLGWAVGLFAFKPLWMYIRGKTAKRTLTISPDGIYTEIGKIRGQVPWRKIKMVASADQYVLITRHGGNSFFIPERAFSGPVNRDQFLTEIDRLMKTKL
jgi:hypothetical protein